MSAFDINSWIKNYFTEMVWAFEFEQLAGFVDDWNNYDIAAKLDQFGKWISAVPVLLR